MSGLGGPAPEVLLRISLDPRIHFALQQNDVPVVRAIDIENRSVMPLHGIHLTIEIEPDIAEPWSARLDALGPGQTHRLEAVDLSLSPVALAALTERVRGRLWLRAAWTAEGRPGACERVEPIEVLARGEWSGLRSLPEILAAFVPPNQPALVPVLREVGEVLRRWGHAPALDGYQSKDRRRVLLLTAAVYTALLRRGIGYINPPASFESDGQRVRPPDQVLEERLGTCIDLTVLVAALLEQIGLFPLLVIVEGHAFAGVWLQDETFGQPSVEEPTRLRKRVELGEIAVFDPTVLTTGGDFARAESEAKRRLEDVDAFRCVIDVQRARHGGIRPMPEGHERREGPSGGAAAAHAGPDLPPPPVVDHIRPEPSHLQDLRGAREPVSLSGRIGQWQRKLLDLSLRNRLLNFRETARTITLACPDLPGLENVLAEGAEFLLVARLADRGAEDPRDPEASRRRSGPDEVRELWASELASRRLGTEYSEGELAKRQLGLYRDSQLALQESGANTLYLALGFLRWFETAASQAPRMAPILLLPAELRRGSVSAGFRLRLTDDEPRINVTLLQMLQQDFGLQTEDLQEIPTDEAGIDVPAVLDRFRWAVKEIDRWEVVEQVSLSSFSFAKFLMWRDLEERGDELLESAVVRHLVETPQEVFAPEAEFPAPERLDVERRPDETFCPLPADSSQLAAVFAAADERTFVLEGPPGTGKSQTITNLIAHCLAVGKTVLFVSEKMAALEVVQKRLEGVGLGRFCLELHSNKARKASVLAQLGQALEAHDVGSQAEWRATTEKVAALRRVLNGYATAIHRKRESGESMFEVLARLIGQGASHAPPVALSFDRLEIVTPEVLAAMRETVAQLANAAETIGGAARHPWRASGCTDLEPGWQRDVPRLLETLDGVLETLARAAATAAARLGLPSADDLGWAGLEVLGRLCIEFAAPQPWTRELLTGRDREALADQVAAIVAALNAREAGRAAATAALGERVVRDADLAKLDLDRLAADLARAEASLWPLSWWRARPVRAALVAAGVPKGGLGGDGLRAAVEQGEELRRRIEAVAALAERAGALFGREWRDGIADPARLRALHASAERIFACALPLALGDPSRAAELREGWATLSTGQRELLQDGGAVAEAVGACTKALEEWHAARRRVDAELQLDPFLAWGGTGEPGAVAMARARVAACRDHVRDLPDWCAWRLRRAAAVQAGLEALVLAHESGGGVLPSQFAAAFEAGFGTWWYEEVLRREPELRRFTGAQHEHVIADFREMDRRLLALSRTAVEARLQARVPARGIGSSMPNSEVGLLSRELQKKRAHMPVRRLFGRIPTLLPRLKPCLLMSPISVAQYLDPSHPRFDLVVFDEASQIPVWDGIGALARGRQAVVVGDPKQLPPTSFFQRMDSDENGGEFDPDAIEDLESILDECIGARLPVRSLDWHYRSRHESLIAFSNHNYYDNRLLIFPSPLREGMGVLWRPVPDGMYDRGRSATNRAEADAVVAELLRRLRDPELRSSSIGIVTFSQRQQELIQDLLEAERRRDPELEPRFAEDAVESVFVKNLENVQGDERDVILFSICYGPDLHGKVAMNFGPLNRDGGERRLNVAITRARRELLVFSTLTADQIDLARTRTGARGVTHLKAFLEYAERGMPALATTSVPTSDADHESPFEREVHRALTERGWVLHPQVGCGGYRIDLAVVDPDAPGRYLLGVECDGANYHRAKTARDRDLLRQGVLEGLGWRLHRVWSTDWWTDPERETERVHAAILRARAAAPAIAAVPVAAVTPQPEPVEAAPAAAVVAETAISEYRVFPPGPRRGDASDFYRTGAERAIRDLLAAVVAYEGPISLALAARRVAAHWEVLRVSSRVLARIERCIDERRVRLVQHPACGSFLWPPELDPSRHAGYRTVPEGTPPPRNAEDLPPGEVANAAMHLLQGAVRVPVDELARQTCRELGFQRTGRRLLERVGIGLELLVASGRALRDGDSMTLSEG